MSKKSNIECSSIFLGRKYYQVCLSKYDSRARQTIRWDETIPHDINFIGYNSDDFPIFRLDGSLLPLLKQATSLNYYPVHYRSDTLSRLGIGSQAIVLKLKNGAQLVQDRFVTSCGSSYGPLDCLPIKDYGHFDRLLNHITD